MVPTHLKGGAAKGGKGWLFDGKHFYDAGIVYSILSVYEQCRYS